MEAKKFEICVERMNRIQIFLVWMTVMLAAEGIRVLLERIAGIEMRVEIILLLLVVGIYILLTKFEGFFPATEVLKVVFEDDKAVFFRGRKKRSILYRDIKEVEKMMIINRYHSDKGYYRVKIKTKWGSYAMYSGEDNNMRLDFVEVGVSKIYKEFQNRGIKCC